MTKRNGGAVVGRACASSLDFGEISAADTGARAGARTSNAGDPFAMVTRIRS